MTRKKATFQQSNEKGSQCQNKSEQADIDHLGSRQVKIIRSPIMSDTNGKDNKKKQQKKSNTNLSQKARKVHQIYFIKLQNTVSQS